MKARVCASGPQRVWHERIVMGIVEKTLLWDYLLRLKYKRDSLRWERANSHNLTTKANNFNPNVVRVGHHSYGPIFVDTHGDTAKLKIGNYVSIGPDVKFLLEVEHHLDHLSTYPFKARLIGGEEPLSKGDIRVGDDVWIGSGVTILSGVRIGQGAVIASGAVVSGDIPPYAIAGGVPAKVIRYRFSKPVIRFLRTLDYGKLDSETAKKHMNDLYLPIEEMSLDEVKKMYEWFPKKENKS